MFDSLRSSIRWWMFKPERLLERMADKGLTPKKCPCCDKWEMLRDYYDICEDCLVDIMSDSNPAYGYTLKSRMFIVYRLLLQGHDSKPWRHVKKDGWKRLPKNVRYYVVPLLKTVLSLLVDHRYEREPTECLDTVGTVSFFNEQDGWWIVSAPSDKWGYELDHDFPEIF